MSALLEIEDLRTHFFTTSGVVKAVNGISYDVQEGETVAIVGESGCVFHPRCPIEMERCSQEAPALREIKPGHRVACTEA